MSALSWLLTVAVMASGSSDPANDWIQLSGSPAEIGAAWGQLNADVIHQDMKATFFKPAREKGLTDADLLERGQRFAEICEIVAPHWLEEARAAARAARVDPELYTAYIGSVYRFLFLGDECTSYAVSKEFTAGNAILFHKTRDNQDRPQSACLVSSDLPGVNRFITVSDASILACMMMVNEKGLAGSADMGGLRPVTPRFRGMMNTFVLRHIAERAATCDDAERILRDFVEKGYYAGGGKTGTHWLFVDRHGTILELSNNEQEVVAKKHDQKVYFSLRQESAAARTLEAAEEPIDFHLFHGVSRDASMCFDSSISGMTVEIHAGRPADLTCAWLALPAKGLAPALVYGGHWHPAATGGRRSLQPAFGVTIPGRPLGIGRSRPAQTSQGHRATRSRFAGARCPAGRHWTPGPRGARCNEHMAKDAARGAVNPVKVGGSYARLDSPLAGSLEWRNGVP